MMLERAMSWAVACAIVLGSVTTAAAQAPEEGGAPAEPGAPATGEPDMGPGTEPAVTPEPEPAPAPAPAPAPTNEPADPYAQSPAAAPAEQEEAGGDADGSGGKADHEQVVGHLGVGLLGSLSVPTGAGTLTLQTIGVRYWLAAEMGLDFGVGIGFDKTKQTQEVGGIEDTLIERTEVGFSLHAGVPIAPVWSDHFTFLIVPEVDFAFGTAKDDTIPDDPDRFGFLVRAGARVGAEIQFGFIDIPQLSLQASIGAYLAVQVDKVKSMGSEATGTNIGFDTTAQGDPWDIFTGSLAAIYYF